MKKKQKTDLLVLACMPLLSMAISLTLNANFLFSILLFYGLPSLWLSIKKPESVKKTALFAAFFSLPLAIIIDYLAWADKSWFVPKSIMPFRFLGAVPLEDFLFGFLLVYSVIIFYEYFLDKGDRQIFNGRMRYLFFPVICAVLAFLLVYLTRPSFLQIDYAYFWMGMILVILPLAAFFRALPRLLSKFLKTAAYFFGLAILFEITGLQLNQWNFPGNHFIGYVRISSYAFPLEEFIFWFALFTISVLYYYEFFDDDRK